MRIFVLMLQFLTRIPIPLQIQVAEDDFGKGIKYFPLIGLLIGSLNVLGYVSFSLVFSKSISIIGVCLLNILITGALHLDGLADTCDGIFSGRSRERSLEIMRDSRIGTNGAIGIFFDLAFRIGLLLPINDRYLMKALLLAPVISRTALAFLICLSPPARSEQGLGNLFLGKSKLRDAGIALLSCLILAAVFLRYQAIVVISCNLIAMFLYNRLIISKMQGMTGDTLGAGNELSEIIVLVSLLLIAGR